MNNNIPANATGGPNKPPDPFLNPFSLKKKFGRRWRIQMEESWAYEKPENRHGYEGWYEQVPTTCGGLSVFTKISPRSSCSSTPQASVPPAAN